MKRKIAVILAVTMVAAMFAGLGTAAAAADYTTTLTGNITRNQLNNAILEIPANGSGIIYIDGTVTWDNAGGYAVINIESGRDVTLIGVGDAKLVMASAPAVNPSSGTRHFTVVRGSLTIDGIDIIGRLNAGGMPVAGGISSGTSANGNQRDVILKNLTMQNCGVDYSSSTLNAGALDVGPGNMAVVDNVRFVDNLGRNLPGAIGIRSGATVSILGNTTITNSWSTNKDTYYGIAAHESAALTIGPNVKFAPDPVSGPFYSNSGYAIALQTNADLDAFRGVGSTPDRFTASVGALPAETDIRNTVEIPIYIGGHESVNYLEIEFEIDNLVFVGMSIDEDSGFKPFRDIGVSGSEGSLVVYNSKGSSSTTMMPLLTLSFEGAAAGDASLTLKSVEAIPFQGPGDVDIILDAVIVDGVAATEFTPIPEWKVTFISDEVEYDVQTVLDDEFASAPAAPTKVADEFNAAYVFGFWTADPEPETGEPQAFDFGAQIKSDIVLYAVWVETPYAIYDLNKTTAVDRVDLSIAMWAAEMENTDADWETRLIGYNAFGLEIYANEADVNNNEDGTYGDGAVDILDFMAIWRNYSA